METQAATEDVDTKIPQPAAPETVIPGAVKTLTDTPQPKPKNPFSKKQKFKADDFFHEHLASGPLHRPRTCVRLRSPLQLRSAGPPLHPLLARRAEGARGRASAACSGTPASSARHLVPDQLLRASSRAAPVCSSGPLPQHPARPPPRARCLPRAFSAMRHPRLASSKRPPAPAPCASLACSASPRSRVGRLAAPSRPAPGPRRLRLHARPPASRLLQHQATAQPASPPLAGSPGPARCVRLHSAPVSSASPCRLATPCRPDRILRLCPRPNLPPPRRLQARSVGCGSPPPGLAAPAYSRGRSATSRPRERPLARATAGCPPAAQANPRASLPFVECAAPGWPHACLASLRPPAPVASSGSPGRPHGPALAHSPDRLPRPPAPTPATRPNILPRASSLADVPGRLLQHPAAGSPGPSPAGSYSRRHPPAAASQLVALIATEVDGHLHLAPLLHQPETLSLQARVDTRELFTESAHRAHRLLEELVTNHASPALELERLAHLVLHLGGCGRGAKRHTTPRQGAGGCHST
nr:vegetative cell wall protein gp1-like [Aegilops tauschii subsp. strangulata]